MNYLRLLAAGCLAAGALHASAPRPSMVTTEYQGKMLPVVRMVGTDPVVMVDGKEKRIRTEPSYILSRAESFSPHRVKLLRINLDRTAFAIVADESNQGENAPRFGNTYFDTTLQSRETLKGGYAAIVMYVIDQVDGELSFPTQVVVRDLPELPAGKETVVRISAPLGTMRNDLRYFLQIFDANGREVITSNMDPAWDYYAMRDAQQLKRGIRKYLAQHPGENRAVEPVMMPKPVFADGVPVPKSEISAVLEITPEGTVRQITLRGELESSAYQDIAQALRGWLFLPQLKDGQPVATKVQVPLQF